MLSKPGICELKPAFKKRKLKANFKLNLKAKLVTAMASIRMSRGIIALVALAMMSVVVSCDRVSAGRYTTMRLRGGAWGGKEQQSQEMVELSAADMRAAAGPQPAPEAAPPQPTLLNHAIEYALAGSFDGIRSGVSQAVGGQMGQWAGAALQKGSSTGGMAFNAVLSKIPFIKRFAVSVISPPSYL